MSRLAWALAAAFLLHLALLRLPVPVQDKPEVTVQGTDHVTVQLVRQEPEKATSQEKADPEPEPEPPVVSEPQNKLVQKAEKFPVQPVELAPVKTKTMVREPVANSSIPASPPDVPEESAAVEKTDAKSPGPAPPPENPDLAGENSRETGMVLEAEPRPSLNRPPVYPELARKRGWQGTVLLEVDVAADGRVESVRVQTSSSYSLLDREALAAVRNWHFKPGSINGRPTATRVMVPIHFMLQDQ